MSNDWHLKRDNVEQIQDLVRQKCDLADKYNIDLLAALGDIFESRKAQEQFVLESLRRILDYIHYREKKLILFPGNHDKTDYESSDSFLGSFSHHPAVKFFSEPSVIGIGPVQDGIECSIMPYYTPELYKKKLDSLLTSDGRKKILLSHIELTGSVNNDGSEIKNCLGRDSFNEFDLVLLGHYHNHQTIGDKIVHLPSICQHNFGENSFKGFTLLYDDLSWEILKSSFKEFRKIEISVKDVADGRIESILNNYDNRESSNIRFIIKGSQEEIKALKLSELERKFGVDIQTQSDEINEAVEYIESVEVGSFTKSIICESFKEFCEERELNYDKGSSYLNKCFENENR